MGSSQSPGSLKIKAVATLIRETWTIAPTSLLKKNLTYSWLFKAYFMKSFAAAKSSLVFIKNRCRGSRSHMFFKIGVLKNFTIFTGKHLCWSLFLIKLQRTPPVAASAKILFYIIFQKDVAEYIAVLHCIIVSFWNLKSFSFAFILCITRCHSSYNSLSFVLTCCHSLSFIVIRSHSLSLVVPHHSSVCSACFFLYVLFYKNLIVLHHGDNTFLFYFNICIKFTF